MLSVLLATISGRSSSRARSLVTGAQMTPEVWWRKNAMASGRDISIRSKGRSLATISRITASMRGRSSGVNGSALAKS